MHIITQHVQVLHQRIDQLVLKSAHQMMIVSLIGSVVAMSVEVLLVLTLLRCVG